MREAMANELFSDIGLFLLGACVRHDFGWLGVKRYNSTIDPGGLLDAARSEREGDRGRAFVVVGNNE